MGVIATAKVVTSSEAKSRPKTEEEEDKAEVLYRYRRSSYNSGRS
jgi:hypothetical protein